MNLHKLFSLKEYNTFNIDVKSAYSFFYLSDESIFELSRSDIFQNNKILVLGGGSNILFADDFNGLVIHMMSKGIEIVKEEDDFVYVKAAAGEIWDEFVEYCVNKNYAGVENLSLIPGTVGAAPVQNIGAYGVELKDVFFELNALNRNTQEKEKFNISDCKFAYRNSVFKNEFKDKFIILDVIFKLTKKHKLNLEYGRLKEELSEIIAPGIKDVRDAVIRIRESKLPDPEKFPNAGSFFKNPVIPEREYLKLKKEFPQLVSYPAGEGKTKLAAGQLIDLCGWKGKRENGVGVYDHQALVIVNYSSVCGKDIYDFSEKVKQSVYKKFGVEIEREVTIIG